MFDIGSGELIVVAAVAVIVLGPETCMKYAQKAGVTLRKVQTDWALAKRHFGTMEPEQLVKKVMPPQKNVIKAAEPVVQNEPAKSPVKPPSVE